MGNTANSLLLVLVYFLKTTLNIHAKNELNTVLGPIHPMSRRPAFHISTLLLCYTYRKVNFISKDFRTCDKCGKVGHAFFFLGFMRLAACLPQFFSCAETCVCLLRLGYHVCKTLLFFFFHIL